MGAKPNERFPTVRLPAAGEVDRVVGATMAALSHERTYGTARFVFSILEVLGWIAVALGVLSAIFSVFGGRLSLLVFAPALYLAISGLVSVTFVQIGRAIVDTAELTRDILCVVRGESPAEDESPQTAVDQSRSWPPDPSKITRSVSNPVLEKGVELEEITRREDEYEDDGITGTIESYEFGGEEFQTLQKAKDARDKSKIEIVNGTIRCPQCRFALMEHAPKCANCGWENVLVK